MKFFFLFLFVLNAVILSAQFDADLMDGYFDALEQNDKFNGSVAVSIDNQIVYKRALGYSDFENKKNNDTETEFIIGSVSKIFTASLVLMAIDEQKIKLNQTIDKFFPSIKNSDKITVEMLLSHRSGIFNITNDSTYLNWNTKPKTEKELVKIISDYDNDFVPNTEFEYSNSNYILLSFLLEKLYGKTFAEILKEKIIQPLGLKRTHFGGKIKPKDNEAYSYYYNGQWIKSDETDVSVPMGAGGISSTPTDLIVFINSLFMGKIITNESLGKMKTTRDGYGLGIFQMPFGKRTGYGHTGGIDDFSSVLSYFDDGKVAISIASNGSDFDNNNVAIAMLSVAYGQEIKFPTFRQTDTEVIPGYTGIFSNGQLGMEIEITERDGTYFAQATGQSAFPIEKKNETEFRFDLAGIVIEFNKDLKFFTLKQGGGEFIFVKQ